MVDSVAAVAVVESAIAGNRLALIETPTESPAQTAPNLLLEGSTRRGPEFLQKTECSDEPETILKGSHSDWEHHLLLTIGRCEKSILPTPFSIECLIILETHDR